MVLHNIKNISNKVILSFIVSLNRNLHLPNILLTSYSLFSCSKRICLRHKVCLYILTHKQSFPLYLTAKNHNVNFEYWWKHCEELLDLVWNNRQNYKHCMPAINFYYWDIWSNHSWIGPYLKCCAESNAHFYNRKI